MIIVGLSEKLSKENTHRFFHISAKILGVISSICSCIVWIPQIVKLLRTGKQGNLSLAMFLMQTPGNAIIIIFQILYHQNWTTWITYVINLAEQGTIVVILLIFMWRDWKIKKELNEFMLVDQEECKEEYYDSDVTGDEIIDLRDVSDIDTAELLSDEDLDV
jgi:uncharacterized protein with PQ loop repeat